MTDKKRVLSGLAITMALLAVIGMGLGGVSGQILSEESYYEEDFTDFNESAIELATDENLQNQYLTDTGAWNHGNHGGRNNDYGIRYGDASTHSYVQGVETNQPFLSRAVHRHDHDGWGGVYMNRTIDIPEGIDNPVLVAETAGFVQYNNDDIRYAVGADNKVRTYRAYDQSPGTTLSRGIQGVSSNDFDKVGTIPRVQDHQWKTQAFDVSGNTTTFYVNSRSNSGNNYHMGVFVRNLYITEGGPNAFQTEVNGWESIPEDDSFGGPDPYEVAVIDQPTADGREKKLRSWGSDLQREFQLDGISDAQNAYFVLEATSHSDHPVQYTVESYGQEVASGSIDSHSTGEETVELDLDTDEVTVNIQSEGQYDVNSAQFSALEETSQGDPLSLNNQPGGITLDADKGYDRTVGTLITGLDLTTDTLLYVVMIALIVGFMVFSYTKSVRGQELAQSLLFGAVIAGVVIVGLVPTMNLATWIFTGDVDRAPLADPALEAEPPTYYSTNFQDGTMNGWQFDNGRGTGSARPVSAGEGFDLRFTGSGDNPGIVQHQEHISLGNSLDTGFVNIDGAAEGAAGYTDPTHEVTVNVRVYVTDDGELESSDMLDPGTNYAEQGQSAQELSNPVTAIPNVEVQMDGETHDVTRDFVIEDAKDGIIRYTGNETLANGNSTSETLNNPSITYETYNDGRNSENAGTMEPGDTFEVNKNEDSEDVAAVSEIARSFDGEVMSNEKMVTFNLDGEYVHTVMIVRDNRGDEDPIAKLSSVRVGATTEGGSVEH